MFLTKLAVYGTIAGTFFAVSAFSTVQITKQINKIPVPNETSEVDDEEEETYVRQMSDTERFINSLTAFGNMEGNLNLTLEKGTYNLSVTGDVFVSMESMDDIKFNADLDITTLGKTFDVKATYLGGTIYTTLEGNNLKLETSSISEIASMFSTMESSIELPETFKNIDTNQLITNLSAMTAEKGEDKITYTCNLLEGIPPIIFTSDLEYNMTSVSLSNFEMEGFKINVNATTKILGKGHNKVVSPETSENPYTNITSYFGTIKQIKSLIDAKEAGIEYELAISKSGNNLSSTSGNANFSLNNGLDLVVDGKLYNADKSKNVSYLVGYQNNNVILDFNDLIKVYYDINNFNNLKSSIESLISNEDIAKLLSNLESVELPIMKMINEGDYNGLIDQYKGIFLSSDQIKLTLSNSIFSENSSNFDIVINLNEEGIKDVNITNLRYNDYALSLKVALKGYEKKDIDLTEYDSVSNIDKVIDQINSLISSKKFNLNIANISYGDYQVNGYIQIDIVKKLYQADITLVVKDNHYHIKLENDKNNYYIHYSDDKNTSNDIKLVISQTSIDSTIESIKNLLNNKDAEFTKLIDSLVNEIKTKIEASSKGINVLDILFEDYLKSFDIIKDELTNNESINVSINGNKLGLESDINLALSLDENTNISGINGNIVINEKNAEFNVNLSDFDANIHPIPLEDRLEIVEEGNSNAGGWVGVSNATNVIKYVTELDNETQEATVNQIKDLIENKNLGTNYNINIYKDDELVFNIAGDADVDLNDLTELTNLKLNLSTNINGTLLDKDFNKDINVKLYEGVVYLEYNHEHKISYSIEDVKDLISIIKNNVMNESSLDLSGIINNLLPASESSDIPLLSLIKNENYLSIINYYKNTYIDNGYLNIVLDGALLGNDDADITLKLKLDHSGISNISINGLYALGYTIDCSFDIKDYTDFNLSEEEIASYPNIRFINNTINQVFDLIESKEAGINYQLALSKNNENLLSTSGNANISLKDELDLTLGGTLYNSDSTKSITYFGAYQDEKVFVNYNDLIKVYYDTNNFSNLTSSVQNLLANEDIAKLMSSLDSIDIPLIKMINDKDYDALLERYEGINIADNQISVTLSNSLFSDNDTNFNVIVNFDDNGIKDINVTNLAYNEYALSLSLELTSYEDVNVDINEFDNISNINKIIDQVNNLITDKKFLLNISNISYDNYQVNGYIQLDLVNNLYQADITLNVNEDNYRIKFENYGDNYYLTYSDSNSNDVKLAIAKDNVDDIIASIESLLDNKDAEFTKLIDSLLDEVKEKIASASNDINVLDILFEDYLKSFDITDESVNVVVNGDKLGLESDINIALNLNNDYISGINGNIVINEKALNINVNLDEYDDNRHAIAIEERSSTINEGNTNEGGWIGVNHVSNVVDYVTSLDNETQEAIVNQIKDLIANKNIGINYNIDLYKNSDNALLINLSGAADLDLSNLEDISNLKVNLSTNFNTEKVNGNIDAKLYEGVIYLAYNDDIKVSYSIDDIKGLVSIIKDRFIGNASLEASFSLEELLPNTDELTSSPIASIIEEGNYLSIINYYKDAYVDNEGYLNLVIDGALIGSDNTSITLKLKADHSGISNISLEGISSLGYTLDLSFDIRDYTEFEISEEEKSTYPNMHYINNVVEQVADLLTSKQTGINYQLALSKNDENLLSTSGKANISLNNELDIVLDGTLYNNDQSKSISYFGGYQNNNVIINYNDLVKLYYDTDNFDALKSSVESLLANENIAKLMDKVESIEIPLIKMINDKDYDALLAKYEGINIDSDLITLSLSNSLFSDNESTFDIKVYLDENGIASIDLSNLRYSDYSLSLSLELDEYEDIDIDLSEYDNISNIDKIIDQVNDIITNKSINLTINNISYDNYQVNGYIQLDLVNNIYQADVSLAIEEDIYRIRFENDETNYYIHYSDNKNTVNPSADDVKLVVSKDSVDSVIDSVKNLLNNKDAEFTKLIDSLVDKVKDKLATSTSEFNLTDIIFEDYLKSFDIVKDELTNNESLNISINGAKLGLESDINLALSLDENTNISGINGNIVINEKNAEFNVNLSDFDANIHPIPLEDRLEIVEEGNSNAGGWVGVSNATNVIKYVTELDNETQEATVNQIKDLIENKKAGVNYNISVYKNKENADNELVFNIAGDVDLDLSNLEQLENVKVNFSGNMTNTNVGKELDSNVAIKLYEGTVYFDYNDQLKFAYSIDDIKDLVTIIKDKISNNSTTDISNVLDSILPSNEDTTSSPIVNIIKEGNYLSLINYYKNSYRSNNGTLTIVLDGALIGNDNVDISISLTTGHNGISNISINGVYALGYTLECSFDIEDYADFSMSEEEKNGYTNLRYINNMFDQIYELVHEKEFKVTLNGNVNLGKGDLAINGVAYAALGEDNDIGIANLTITDSKNKTHNVKLDVNRVKEGENALADSQVAFIYNNNLKGYLNLQSLTDTFDLIKQLASDGNPLFDKIKGLLSRDTTQSTLTKVMNGEPEAILYDNTLDSITHGTNSDGSHYYDIQLNGNLFKKDTDLEVSPIHILINMDNTNKFTGITLKGSINGYSLDITAGIAKETSNPSTWDRINVTNKFYNFSDIKTLAEYLFETGTKKDFSLSGTISANVASIFNVADISMSAKVHIDDDNNTIAMIEINNIPEISYIGGLISVSDDDWDYRKTTIYLTDEEVYIYVYYYDDYTSWFKSYRKTTTKWVKLSMSEFADDIAYYLVNYSLGVTTGKIAGQSLDMRNQTSSSDKDVDYSKILSNYSYTNNGTPTWNLGINLAELAESSMLDTLNATITGNSQTKLLSGISASTKLASIVNASINASLDNTNYIGDNVVNSINTYIQTHSADTNKHSYSNVTDVKK